VLVAALAGGDLIRDAYSEAIRCRYRFFSYGDAMLILWRHARGLSHQFRVVAVARPLLRNSSGRSRAEGSATPCALTYQARGAAGACMNPLYSYPYGMVAMATNIRSARRCASFVYSRSDLREQAHELCRLARELREESDRVRAVSARLRAARRACHDSRTGLARTPQRFELESL
jgi:hypothetical protein